MRVALRQAGAADAAAWAEIVAACSPYMVQDARSTEHEMRTEPPAARRLVADVDGTVVGISRLYLHPDEDHGNLMVMVPPAHRRRGVGRALLEAQLPVAVAAGRIRVVSIVEDDEGARRASSHCGFREVRRFQMAMVDPRDVPAPEPLPDGVQVLPLSALGPRVVWKAHSSVVRDDPSGISLPMAYDEFQDEWADPRMRPDLGRAVLVEGEVAAFTMLGAAGERAWSDMTGTMPGLRGLGYARIAKEHALVAAAGAGITRAVTGNDDANLPMVTINRRLGYRPFAAPVLAELSLGQAGGAPSDAAQ